MNALRDESKAAIRSSIHMSRRTSQMRGDLDTLQLAEPRLTSHHMPAPPILPPNQGSNFPYQTSDINRRYEDTSTCAPEKENPAVDNVSNDLTTIPSLAIPGSLVASLSTPTHTLLPPTLPRSKSETSISSFRDRAMCRIEITGSPASSDEPVQGRMVPLVERKAERSPSSSHRPDGKPTGNHRSQIPRPPPLPMVSKPHPPIMLQYSNKSTSQPPPRSLTRLSTRIHANSVDGRVDRMKNPGSFTIPEDVET